jgi:hypothetical protein
MIVKYSFGGTMKRIGLAFLVLLLFSVSAVSFEPFIETEQGTIGVLHHTYKNGTDPADTTMSTFDFVNQGGQDLLFPFSRYAVGATIAKRHRAWFTYQPLEVVTNVKVPSGETVYVGSETFAAGTPLELTYSFPFYRFSYTFDLLGKQDHAVLGVGLVLQIRDVSVKFKALDDSKKLYVANNVGLVPALAIYSEYSFPFGLTLSADIAGSYAKSSFFNGADFEFEGSILDASLRMSYALRNGFELFGVARFFGGTSNGTSSYPSDSWSVSDNRYSQNNIATLTASVGLKWSN